MFTHLWIYFLYVHWSCDICNCLFVYLHIFVNFLRSSKQIHVRWNKSWCLHRKFWSSDLCVSDWSCDLCVSDWSCDLCVSGLGVRRGGSADPGRSSVFGRVGGQDLWPAQTDEVSWLGRFAAVEPRGETPSHMPRLKCMTRDAVMLLSDWLCLCLCVCPVEV